MDRRTARFGLVTLLPGLFALLVTGCGGAASAARPIPNRQPIPNQQLKPNQPSKPIRQPKPT